MRTRAATRIASIALAAMVSACSSSVAVKSKTEDAAAKTFAIQPGKSSIYVFRSEALHQSAISVSLDQQVWSRTGPCTYLVWAVDPGRHIVTSQAENVTQLILSTEPNKTYYVRQDVQGGLYQPRIKLTPADEADARKAIGACSLVDSGMPEARK